MSWLFAVNDAPVAHCPPPVGEAEVCDYSDLHSLLRYALSSLKSLSASETNDN
ncbi:MAG: hypothetical protein ABW124_14345 [Candidatus Thiodiazotropha sp. 6PLUC9]